MVAKVSSMERLAQPGVNDHEELKRLEHRRASKQDGEEDQKCENLQVAYGQKARGRFLVIVALTSEEFALFPQDLFPYFVQVNHRIVDRR